PTELLWTSGAPGALGNEDTDKPSLTIYLPAGRNTGSAVVVCPGGGYRTLAMDHEGKQIAEWLNSLGISAFLLKYRLGPRYHHPIEIGDAQRALRMVRSRAKEFRVDAKRIGIWGFSAGGHLAATAATHFDAGNPSAPDAIDRVSSRPDFAVLAYPVISFTTGYTHKGSRTNLLGENPDPALVNLLSGELQVKSDTPPVFLFHTNEDTSVPPENSILFYLALRKHNIPAELHIYEKGRHGVGLASTDATLGTWTGRLADWFRTRGLLDAGR
ncbi:MAG: alpha/beta hydrolase, partial [Acidobacteriia bacterium]|nr:alpha/beta hydrolase [Terriglobia bacterium]